METLGRYAKNYRKHSLCLGCVANGTMMAKKSRFSAFRYSHTLCILRYDTQKQRFFAHPSTIVNTP